MSTNPRDRSSPQMAYDYAQNLLHNSQPQYVQYALAACYNYLTQKKIQWSIKLEKLMQLFLDLAFTTGRYSKIKQVLKIYRNNTQTQHPDSLKSILEYYRDNKLEQILDQQLKKQQLPQIRKMSNIEDDQASSQIILSSLNPEAKSGREEIKGNLKIVWEGYKSIIDIVRFNQKLESVFIGTMKKVFVFVERFNRKHQFKSFCQYIRSTLKNILNKRSESKGIYIDIQKQQINTNNIQFRFEQFDLAIKLGLWQQSFQILDDINQIMKVRKGPVKNQLKCGYFQRLSIIFKKSNYWYYHANAFFNYYSIYITKSNLQPAQKTRVADKLILSILCIPPSTLESHQSKESRQKIASMMVLSNKIPDKSQLEEMMISRGVVETASNAIKQLWYFMFLDFDLTSLTKGLKLLKNISQKQQYKQFIDLLQEILIYKQLISLAQVYQRIKYESLISIIPLPKEKIQKILFQCHQRKVVDFILDQKQGVIIFKDQVQETNPYDQLLQCYIDVALLHEQKRKYDTSFIINKTIDFIQTADKYYNEIRVYKIDQYRKKLKKPKQQLEQRQRQRQKKIQQQKRNQQLIKRQKQLEQKREEEEKKILMIEKYVKFNEIITAKQKRIVRIGNKRIEDLTEDEIMELDKEVFQKVLKQVTTKVANDKENRNKKRFTKIDYAQRQRRNQMKQIITKSFVQQQKQKQQFEKLREIAKTDYQQRQKLKNQIQKIAPQVKTKIDHYYNENRQKYEQNMRRFKQNLTDEFKKKILNQARQLYKDAEQKKKLDEQKRRKQQISQVSTQWAFKKVVKKVDETGKVVVDSGQGQWKRKQRSQIQQQAASQQTQASGKRIKNEQNLWKFKKGPPIGGTMGNAFANLKMQDDQKPKKQKWIGGKTTQNQGQKVEEKKQQGVWGRKNVNVNVNETQKQQTTQPKKQQKPTKFVPPPVEGQAKGAWGKGKTEQKKQQPKKDNQTQNQNQNQNQKPKGRGW